jgi:hypothetical protein
MKGVATTNKIKIELQEIQEKLEDQNKNDVIFFSM